ncbi:50S ribosomal protein L9 [Candidatus Margulisiibacteriota bacterium]
MRVILKEDNVHLGDKGSVVEVANGYARNYLIPKGFAVAATTGAIKHNQVILQSQEKKHEKEKQNMLEIAEKINQTEIVIKTDVGENGRLFGSITSMQIVQAIKETLDIDIDKKRIGIHQPLKSIGEFQIPVKVFTGVNAVLKVIIVDKDAKVTTAPKAKAEEKKKEKKSELKEEPKDEAEVIEAPVVEEPKDEAEVTEAPVVEEPKDETEVTEAPVVEEPKDEAEVTEAPVVEEPKDEAEVTEAPVVEEPKDEAEVIEAPVVEEPQEAPSTEETANADTDDKE